MEKKSEKKGHEIKEEKIFENVSKENVLNYIKSQELYEKSK